MGNEPEMIVEQTDDGLWVARGNGAVAYIYVTATDRRTAIVMWVFDFVRQLEMVRVPVTWPGAPTHIQTRGRELGAGELMMRLGGAYVGFRQFCDGWLRVERTYGPDAVAAVYQAVLAGRTDPATGQIISLWPGEK